MVAGVAISTVSSSDSVISQDTGVSTTIEETSTSLESTTTTEVVSTTSSVPSSVAPETTSTVAVPTTTTTVLTRKDIKVIYSLRPKSRVAFITIDDGGYISPSLVRYLNSNKIPINSFVMPEPLLWQWPKFRQVKLMKYGNHSNTHGHMRRMTFAQQKEEICRAKKLVGRISRQIPTLFRPPGGDWNETTKAAMAACGTRYLIMWNVIADNQLIRMRRSHKLMPGDIILMHYRADLVQSLKWVMAQLKHDKLKPAFLSDYLKYG